MSDDLELQNRIAMLAGRINRHKAADTVATPPPAPLPSGYGYRGRPHGWQGQRGSPYGVPRGSPSSPIRNGHRHRTLVVNGGAQQETSVAQTPAGSTSTPSGWVTKRDRHMQLINPNVYEKKTQERARAMAETRKKKETERAARELTKVNSFARTTGIQQARSQQQGLAQIPYQITIHDIQFVLADGGSKLIRTSDDRNLGKETPKRANIGGVAFLRSRRGNLYRAGLIKAKRRADVKRLNEPCPLFSTTGSCLKGPSCRFLHDADRVAICRDFLLTGKCHAGVDCDLSHDPTPERVPACLHFVRGNCTNPDCRYAHVKPNPGAPVCRAFARLGYCPKGASCAERHVHECPDYANKGICRNKTCRLPHVDRAGQLRKAAAGHDAENDAEASSDLSSDEELDDVDSDDVDSDDLADDVSMSDSPALSQQRDFVKF